MRSISRRKLLAKESEKMGRNSLPGFITGGMVFLFSNLHVWKQSTSALSKRTSHKKKDEPHQRQACT